jgi:2',3'-cyclic-nucleotide 2'-phosphodiesterase (5'-nucleotidase family)
MLPFNNTLTVLTMEGRDLTALMTRTVEGASPVTLEMSGMAVGLLEGADGAQLQSLQIAGEPVDPDRTYKVATNSYMAGGGDGFDEFTFVRERSDEGLIQRDLIENFFLKEPAGITPPGENRYSVESK